MTQCRPIASNVLASATSRTSKDASKTKNLKRSNFCVSGNFVFESADALCDKSGGENLETLASKLDCMDFSQMNSHVI